MADSLILVTSATATGGIQQIVHKATTDFQPGSCLSYLALISIEVWSASSNNRNAAVKVGEIPAGGQFIQTGLAKNATRYSWYRAVDVSENTGEWYPAASNAGIVAATSNETLPAGSVGPVQTGNNFPSLSVISGNFGDIIAGTVTGVTFTGGVFRTAASGRRIEINGSTNYVAAYNPLGGLVARFGYNTISGTAHILYGDMNSVSDACVLLNNMSGRTIISNGGVDISAWDQTRSALKAQHNGTGANSHAFLFDAWGGGGSNTGGAGVLGVSKTGGGYCLYMNRGGIGPFTGQHPGLIRRGDEAIMGDILVDMRVLARIDIDNTVTEVGIAGESGQHSAIGVLSKRLVDWSADALSLPPPLRHMEASYDYVVVNAVGEGQINVCGLGGDLEPGDYICASDLPGKGQRQNRPFDDLADDLQRRCTVARVRERVTFASPTEWKRVACIYLCG